MMQSLWSAVRRWLHHPESVLGRQHMWAQAAGIAAWGMMTGVAMSNSGLSVASAIVMTVMVYAGSAQLAVLPLLVAGAPIWVIALTTACVNLRFLVFSLHLRNYLMHLPRSFRVLLGFGIGDLTYVLFTKRFPHPGQTLQEQEDRVAYLVGSCAVNWCCWMLPSIVGIVLASWIPVHWGLGFAGILCLVGLLCSLATSHLRRISGICAAVVAVVTYSAPFKLSIVLAVASSMFLCLMLERMKPLVPPVSSR